MDERRIDFVRPGDLTSPVEYRGKWVGSTWRPSGKRDGYLVQSSTRQTRPVFESELEARAWNARLTEPQTRLLLRVAAQGEVRLNGRARKTVKALQDTGLVEVEHDLRLAAIGKATELFIVRLREDTA